MKSKTRMLCTLMALILVFSLTGVSAFADMLVVPGGAVLSVAVTAERDDVTPGSYTNDAGEEVFLNPDVVLIDGAEVPVCSVSYVDRYNSELGAVDSVTSIISQEIGIRLQPLDGFYISALSLTSGDDTGSQNNLLSAATANLGTTAVTLFLADISDAGSNGYTLDGSYLSSWSLGGEMTLNVTCSRISPDEVHSVWYDSGDHDAEMPGGDSGYGAWTHYTAMMPNTVINEGDSYWEFTGYELVYNNGAHRQVEEDDEICVYTDATLIAQWRDATDEYAAPVEEYVEEYTDNNDDYGFIENIQPDQFEDDSIQSFGLESNMLTAPTPVKPAIPAAMVQAPGATREFDGYPLTVDPGRDVMLISDEYGNTFRVIMDYAGGSRTEIGTTANTVTSYELHDANDELLYSQTELEESGVFRVLDGTITVTEPSYKQVLTVRGVTATVDATYADQSFNAADLGAEWGYTGGYQADGLLPGHWIEGTDIVSGSGSTDFDSVVNTDAVRVYMNNGIETVDVTPLYDIHGENGQVTVNAFVPEPTPVIPTTTVEAPSLSKPFDGTPLTMAAGSDVTVVTDGQGITYRIVIEYAGGSRTEIGTQENTVTNYYINNANDELLFSREDIDKSGALRILNGTLTVADPDALQTLTVTGVTATVTVKSNDTLVKAADCGADDGYTDGYKVSGLFEGHRVVGENIVTGEGTSASFETVVHSDAIHVLNADDQDVTPLYTINPVNGYVTVNVELPDEPTTPPEPDKPVVPTLILKGKDASKEYDGQPLTMSGKDGYTLAGDLGDYDLVVTYNSQTTVGSVEAISGYEIRDKDGKTVFTKEELDASKNFTVESLGKLTVTQPAPSIPKVKLTSASETREYNGAALTKDGVDGAVTVSGDLGEYELRVSYNSITEPGSVDTLESYALYKNGSVAFTKEELDASPNFTVNNGKLTVNKRALKLIAISGTLNTKGETITASSLSSQDGSFKNGYRVIGLLDGHQLSGNFVQGSGKESFKTSINKDAVRVTASNTSWDVTNCYDIQTQDGYITINAPTTYDLIVNPKSYTWTYDGTAHSLRDYDFSGLVNGDRLVKVNFSSDSTITNVGSQSNRITSVEVTTASGGDVDANKYILISTPGTLTVEQRDLTVTAVSGTLTTTGGTIVASSLSTPDGSFKNGFKAEGLVPGHSVMGNFVVGSGTSTFTTSIDLNNLRVVDANGADVTRNYRIYTQNGTITINSSTATQQQSRVPLSVTAKSGTFTYDGNEHRMNEYTASGLVDGDVIEKVNFKPSSVITNVGTQANEIQSVVIKSSSGAAVDNSKYNINYYSGTLTVTKYPLTLTAVSDEKVYDGKALNNKSVKATALANSGHKLSADYEVYDSNGNSIKNGPVDPGVYTKKVSNVQITSGATDVTANYDIKMIDGTLKITGTGGESSRATTTTAYYGNTFTIRSDAPYSEFQYLMIDGQKISADNYTVKEGSTIITLKSAYIQSLKSGSHNYTIVSTSKQVDGSFNVSKAPKTGDGGSMVAWILLLLVMAVAVAIGVFLLQRAGKLGGGKRRGTKNSRTGETLHYPSGKEYVKKPVSTVVPDLDFEPDPEPVYDDDPTMDLMKDFDINLDDFRTEEPRTAAAPTAPRTPVAPVENAPAEPAVGSFTEPDFGSFSTGEKAPEPVAKEAPKEELPDIEVEITEEADTTEPETSETETVPEPKENPEPPRRRGRHEAPDPSDPFTDSWYQSMGLGRHDKKK